MAWYLVKHRDNFILLIISSTNMTALKILTRLQESRHLTQCSETLCIDRWKYM